MRLRWIALVAFPLLVAGIACSGIGSFDSSSPSAAGVGGTSGVFGVVPGPCPVAAISADARCTAQLVCEYGTSSSASCNTMAVCNEQAAFDITPPSTNDCDDRCPTFDAPGAVATAQGTACLHGSRGSLICPSPYDRSTCGCAESGASDGGVPPPTSDASTTADGSVDPDASTSTDDGGEAGAAPADVPGVWLCVTPPVGCPAARPPLGSACVREMICDYGACLFPGGMKVACVASTNGSGHWVDQTPVQCGGKT